MVPESDQGESTWMVDVAVPLKQASSEDPPLRREHWTFFEEEVLPFLSELIARTFPAKVSATIRQRLSISERFRASEVYFAMSRDLDQRRNPSVHGCAAVELLVLGRLFHDDVIDRHDYRWGLPSLRLTHGDEVAALVANKLRSLALLCASQIPLLNSSGQNSIIEMTVQFDNRIWSSMLSELTFDHGPMSMSSYLDIAGGKHSNGALCAHLAGRQYGLDGKDLEHLEASVSHTDFAAAIANDLSEAHQRRGIDSIRFPGGERRGERTEFELGRPTIFNVFLASDERVRSQPEHLLFDTQFDLRHIAPGEIYAVLDEMGGIAYAESQRNLHKNLARQNLQGDWPELREWMGSTAPPNLPPDGAADDEKLHPRAS